MEPDRWREIEEVLHAACEQEPQRREVWLAKRCASDANLFEEVRSLLALRERSEQFLETPALAQAPQRIGDYEIVRRISSGGSAVVYEARHLTTRATVAVKVLRGGVFADERRLRRFRREVETLARLRHPSIARIFEAGETDLGERFFSMELVPGVPLHTYASEQRPALDERLRLFAALCDGVAYAHARGVVHRDLKPDNVLVDQGGQLKILDFGIAHVDDTDGMPRSTTEHTGEVLGTLRYMSPEQARGHPAEIDHRTDVYSLGVMLYELVTGRLPYDVTRVLPHEALRLICEQEPVRPSAVSHALRGPLETVMLKALEKEPQGRYATVRELGEDVDAVLDGRAIRARPPGAVQRAHRALRRHKLAAGVIASVIVTLAVFSGTAWFKNVELRAKNAEIRVAEQNALAQTARTEAEARRSRAVLDFLSGALTVLDPDLGLGPDVTLRAFLDRASAQLSADADAPPPVRAELHALIGRAYLSLGQDQRAEPHLRARLELLAQHAPESAIGRASAYRDLGRALDGLGRYEDALVAFDASLTIHRDHGADETVLAGLLLNTVRVLTRLGRREEARERLDEVLSIGRASGGRARDTAVETLAFLAEGLALQGEHAAAEAYVDEALELQLQGSGELRTMSARLLAQKAQIRIDQGRPEDAEAPLIRSLAIRKELLGPDHPERIATQNNLATLYVELGRFADAEPLLYEVLEAWRALGLDKHEDYAGTLSTLGVVQAEQARPEEAAATLREALTVYRASAAKDPLALASHSSNLARVLAMNGELDQARELATEALELRRETVGERHPAYASSLALLGELTVAGGDLAEAEAIFREVLRLHEELLPADHIILSFSTNSLGVVLQERGELEEAEALLRRSVEISTAHLGESHPDTALRLSNLADVLVDRGAIEEAVQLKSRALELTRAALGPRHPDVVRRGAALAGLLAEQGRTSEALPVAEAAAAGAREVFANDSRRQAEVLLLLAELYLDANDPERARPLLDECEAWERAGRLDGPTADRARRLVARGRTGAAPSEATDPRSAAAGDGN